ncbi:hypothetical protein F2Q65_01875 [Thiohalocapsa marina]|uniref:Glycosyltransferase n=1 Tax=Thiohalocapsa marina TaxID=424902 RepID=A0A5M8FU22_9GAMM|nr:hypothetical protein [Thiohalocapsa marina]KAA6187300.1 hypothetical protein F2Q65_01875 [Thiohalocapsa marina]
MQNNGRVLAIGVFLADVPNHATTISESLLGSSDWSVDLRWASIGARTPPTALRTSTALALKQPVPKFELLNRLLRDVNPNDYSFILVIDDDVELPPHWLNEFLRWQMQLDLALAQPARTHDSYIDHYFVAQLVGIAGRTTRFVEIGPVFCIAPPAYPLLLPFDEQAPMGWGLDFVWPALLEANDLRLGIIDACPVRHALRKPVTHYDYQETARAMDAYLAARQHLTYDASQVALETYRFPQARAATGDGTCG